MILAYKKSKTFEDILKVPPKKWCKAFFNIDSKIDLVDNNLCEAFNETLLEARKKSIIYLFKHVLKLLQSTWLSLIEMLGMR